MIKAIAFSKDRACQLRLMIDSVKKNAPFLDITVIYDTSSKAFKDGYDKLEKEYSDIKYIYQEGRPLKQLVLQSFDKSPYICFICDDEIIYRPVKEQDIVTALSDIDIICFAFGRGLNNVKSYMMGIDNPMHNYEEEGNIIKWNWTTHRAENGYPLAVSGHIFRTPEILSMIKKIEFVSPNKFEAALQNFNRDITRHKMAAYKHSVLINVPINRVQTDYKNEFGREVFVEITELNDRYLKGYAIDLNKLDFSNIEDFHKEVKPYFTKIKNGNRR